MMTVTIFVTHTTSILSFSEVRCQICRRATPFRHNTTNHGTFRSQDSTNISTLEEFRDRNKLAVSSAKKNLTNEKEIV